MEVVDSDELCSECSSSTSQWSMDLDAPQTKLRAAPSLPRLVSDRDAAVQSPGDSATMVLDETVSARILSSLRTTEDALELYQPWTYFDNQFAILYVLVQKLSSTLRVLSIALEQDLDYPQPESTLESLESSKRVTAPLLDQLSQLERDNSPNGRKRPSLIPRAFEDREGLILSFRKRMQNKLHEAVSEIREVAISVEDDLDLVAKTVQRKLLVYHIEKWPDEEVPFPIFKPPPLQRSGFSQNCDACARIFALRESWLMSSGINPFQPSLSLRTSTLEIFDSAYLGCKFCRLQASRLLQRGGVVSDIQYAHITWWRYWIGEHDGNHDINSYSKDLRIRYLSGDFSTVCFDYYITESLTEADTARRIGKTTSSRTTLAIANSWIANCLKHHTTCNLTNVTNLQRPSRLVYVGGSDTLDLRIVEEIEISSRTLYMTLSHCWNNKETPQLLKTNYQTFSQRIPESSLPKAYVDAVKITRRLGVAYLWIDSLCIIQDSGQDWRVESAKIADIYAGSWCNIAATSSNDDTHSLHPDRNHHEVEECIIKSSSSSIFSIRAHDEGYKYWQSSVTESPLLKRGWVFQELRMAPRTLFYGQDQLMWRCKTQNACEKFPTTLDVTARRYHSTPGAHNTVQIAYYGPDGWGEVVQDYSKLDFTFPKQDKLIAIAGIAKMHGKEEEYLAGLWEQDLLYQLTWRVTASRKVQPPPTEYQSPSWSWAALNQEITYTSRPSKMHIHTPIAKILSTTLTHASSNRFGQVTQGILHLHAPIISIEYHRLSKSSYTLTHHTSRPFTLPNHTSPTPTRSISLDHEPRFKPSLLDDDTDTEEQTYLIPVYLTQEPHTGRRVGVHGLIVEATGGMREFRRKGVLTLEGRNWVEGLKEGCKRFIGKAEEGIFEGLVGENEGGWVEFEVWVV